MITTTLIKLARFFFSWFMSLLPGSGNLPTWLKEVTDGIGAVVSGMASWSVWIPWTQLTAIAVFCFALWGFSWIAHLIKTLIKFIPFIGG